jgi:hypothetical protein
MLVTANIPSSLILVTLMMEALRSSETSVLTKATRCNVPEDGIIFSLVKLYMCLKWETKLNAECFHDVE